MRGNYKNKVVKQEGRKEKNSRGITLIALVVTIIVLIILAVIGINSAIGENGLIKQAEETKSGQEERMATDGERMGRLADGYANEVAEQSKIETDDGDDGATKVAENPETYYGKTINYSANGINDWKIFYSNGTNIFLITSEYLPIAKVPTEAGMTTTGTYQAYWKPAPATLDTTNRQDELFMATGYTLNGINANSKCVSKLLNTDIWKNFAEGTKAEYAIGSPTLEMWVASWNARYPSDKIKCQPSASEKSSEGTGYKIGWNYETDGEGYITSSEMNKKAGYSDTLYFPHKSEEQGCTGYWITSPGWGGEFRIMYVTGGGAVNGVTHTYANYGLRPVVSLDSTVNLTPGSSGYDFNIISL